MNYIINGRKPEQIFRFFEEICSIPHGSGDEKAIADYLVDFANKRNLEVVRDSINNVFIRKAATKGRENDPAILLQAHTDMVCEKNDGTDHDFLTDPLNLYIDGNCLRARGTTLGADDGIGVAAMMSVLDGAVESHPALECLFTVSEETGMDGVNGFDFSLVKARRMINLDAAEIDTAYVGCAGGVRCNLIIDGERTPAAGKALKITVNGLAGGHSGENINDGRDNANKIMGRILLALKKEGYLLAEIRGGGKSNAIPRECRAIIVTDQPEHITDHVNKLAAEIAAELSELDSGFAVSCDGVELPGVVFDKQSTTRIVGLLGVVANGVLSMSKKIPGFVEYSRNLGVIVTENDKVIFTFFARSAINAQMEYSNYELEALAELCGATVKYSEMYGGWNYAPVSPIRDAYVKAYRDVTGKELRLASIHAGLECGVIKAQIPDMDIISVGPNEFDIHSPDEALDLDSVETLSKILERLLSC